MLSTTLRTILSTACLIATCGASYSEEVSFGRDIRPLLAKHCFTCHGPDAEAREADLRLDTFAGATSDLGGYQAIKPGRAADSELMVRITSDDPDLRMPPADSSAPLSDQEIKLLEQWIASGGEYQTHWAFVPPKSPRVPDISSSADWCQSPIDRFLLHRMQAAKLKPSTRADKLALVRRTYLDLAGVNPTQAEVDRFLRDDHPAAYRRLVDRLLASPDYAERFARPWLDLARYSDTNGYEKDRPRTIWPYRDWVIEAIATDQPYDQFSIEQLAGDMLPNATASQRIATGFHRNTMMNEEGGIDPLEFRFYALVDRVATTGTVWMGLTTGCAQCHTHKYDPITHTDYYALLALMNQADEPELSVPSSEIAQRRAQILAQVARKESDVIQRVFDPATKTNAEIIADYEKWKATQLDLSNHWTVTRPIEMDSTMPRLVITDEGSILASGDVTKRDVYTLTMPATKAAITALRLEVLPHESLPASGPGMAFYEGRKGDFFLSELQVTHGDSVVPLRDASISFGKITVGSGKAEGKNVLDGEGSTGWSTASHEGKSNRLVVNFDQPFQSDQPWKLTLIFERHFAAALGHFRISVTHRDTMAKATRHEADFENALWLAKSQRTELSADDEYLLRRSYLHSSKRLEKQRREITQLEKRIPNPTRTLVMRERANDDRRETRRHHRGEYLQPKETVQPAVPAVFPQLAESRADRLGMARWLVSAQNPMVGRVTANRAWRQFFRYGIVRTAGDFGTQSEPPSHPQLLDWLAVDLSQNGWSIKRLHRQIVLSAAYQQSLGAAPETDPANRLLSRFPHRRLEAERLRDALLSCSGLLSRRVGGPSVYPPQSPVVMKMAWGGPAWKPSTGGDRYRKSLYTFSKRTAPFAAFITFDGSSGELCLARRESSTTPLQALTLLNDEMYMEIANGIADASQRSLPESASDRDRVVDLFRRILVRPPAGDEINAILDFFHKHQDKDNAWALVARVLINTDEAITTP